jgi:hypothetical protein
MIMMLVSTADVVPVKRSPLVYGNDSMNLNIILTNLDCNGTESSLLDCQINSKAMRHCDHSEDAGVRCGGIVVLYYYNTVTKEGL